MGSYIFTLNDHSPNPIYLILRLNIYNLREYPSQLIKLVTNFNDVHKITHIFRKKGN